jgi:hypothetical protein
MMLVGMTAPIKMDGDTSREDGITPGDAVGRFEGQPRGDEAPHEGCYAEFFGWPVTDVAGARARVAGGV